MSGVDKYMNKDGEEEAKGQYTLKRENRGQALMLDLRLKTGDCSAFAYSYLISIRFDASGEMILSFSTHKVTIAGRNLREIYNHLLRQRITSVTENESMFDDGGKDSIFIEKITVEEV